MNIVQTKLGQVSGIGSDDPKYAGITYFNSIPYAAPPIGDLRWMPPADHEPWEGVRDCSGFADRPMQGMTSCPEPYGSDFYWEGFPPMSEDCLYLSVATGAVNAGEKRPVFMWFHGGGLAHGHYYEREFDPSELARKGIVVVSVGQRLNVFGYLSLPQLSAEQGGKSGNYGLMDEVKALDWVTDNIAAFGGDPDNITVGGQSGGTAKSATLATCPLAQGRVKRVINQSPLHWLVGNVMDSKFTHAYRTLERHASECRRMLKAIGIDPDLPVEDLRAIPAERFYANTQGNGRALPGELICDGEYIPYPDPVRNQAEYAADCDYLTGTTYGECQMMPGMMLAAPRVRSAAAVYARAKELLGDLYETYDFENLVPMTDETADHVSRRLAAEGLTDNKAFSGLMLFRLFGAYQARHAPQSRVWSYLFSRVPPCRPEEKGGPRDSDDLLSWHSSELFYTFASLRDGVPPARPWEATDFRLADTMSSYWANFIKTGDPNGEGLPVWPRSDAGFGWIELGDEVRGHAGIEPGIDEMIYEFKKRFGGVPE